MKTIFLLIILHTLVFLSPARAWDWGNSNNLFIKKTLNDRWSIVSRSLFTSRDDMSDIFFGIADIGLRYKVVDWLSVDGVYRGAWFESSAGWEYENRPLININLGKKFGGFFLSNRSRFEFRIYADDRQDDIRYRNEIRIITPFELTKWKLIPYFEEEFFYGYKDGEINMNWLTGGLRYNINKNTKVKLGYRWQTQKLGGTWKNRHVLVTGLLIFF